jgi:transposase
LTNYLIITNSVLEKYISYKLPTYKSINEFNNILNWNELMTISDCVLDIVDKLKENKIQNKEINLILHNIFKLVLKKNNIDIQDGSIVKNNK